MLFESYLKKRVSLNRSAEYTEHTRHTRNRTSEPSCKTKALFPCRSMVTHVIRFVKIFHQHKHAGAYICQSCDTEKKKKFCRYILRTCLDHSSAALRLNISLFTGYLPFLKDSFFYKSSVHIIEKVK